MSVDFNASQEAPRPQDDELLFAPTPIWERSKTRKRRGSSARVAAPSDSAESTPPASRTQRNLTGPAVAAGVAALVVIGGVAWYANQPRNDGMAQLTPGAPVETQQVAANSTPTAAHLPPPAAATPAAEDTGPVRATVNLASRDTHRVTTTRRTSSTATRSVTRARPSSDYSAMDAGVNASAAAPSVNPPAPVASSTTTGAAAGTTMTNPAVNPAPAQPPAGAVATPSAATTTTTTTTDGPVSATTP